MTDNKFNVSFRCYFERNGDMLFNTHYVPDFPLADIPKWIECYRFTHPNVMSINVKIWFVNGRFADGQDDGDESAD